MKEENIEVFKSEPGIKSLQVTLGVYFVYKTLSKIHLEC